MAKTAGITISSSQLSVVNRSTSVGGDKLSTIPFVPLEVWY